jgi:hypothetical protein
MAVERRYRDRSMASDHFVPEAMLFLDFPPRHAVPSRSTSGGKPVKKQLAELGAEKGIVRRSGKAVIFSTQANL